MIFVGNGALLKNALSYTLQRQYTIDMVYCPSNELSFFFQKHNIPFKITANINDEIEDMIAVATDKIVFSINNGWIFRRDILALPGFRFYNIHNGILPHYRGIPLVCIIYAILNGDTEYGVTLHRVDEGIDTGSSIAVKRFAISPADNFESVMSKGLEYCRTVFEDNVDKIVTGGYSYMETAGGPSKLYSVKDLHMLSAHRANPRLQQALHFGIFKLWYRNIHESISEMVL